jgi:hypothetical protein
MEDYIFQILDTQVSVVIVLVMDVTFVVEDDFFLFGLDIQVLAVIRQLYYNFRFRLHLAMHVIENEEWGWVFRHRRCR